VLERVNSFVPDGSDSALLLNSSSRSDNKSLTEVPFQAEPAVSPYSFIFGKRSQLDPNAEEIEQKSTQVTHLIGAVDRKNVHHRLGKFLCICRLTDDRNLLNQPFCRFDEKREKGKTQTNG